MTGTKPHAKLTRFEVLFVYLVFGVLFPGMLAAIGAALLALLPFVSFWPAFVVLFLLIRFRPT